MLCALAGQGASVDADESAPAEPPPSKAAIDKAAARGVAWLRGEQAKDGGFGAQAGETALALLALRHSAVAQDDPACRRAAAFLLRALPDGTSYGASLGTVALLAQDGAPCFEKAAALAADLVGAQCPNGQWSYAARRSARATAGDNSNTQIAVFALAAARARGIEVPRETFERCAAYFRRTRNADGGWGYAEKERASSYASMTAGGILSMALCAGTPAPGDARLAESAEIRGALAWLAERFDPAENAGAAGAFGAK